MLAQQFVRQCAELSNDEIYEKFENADDAMREAVFDEARRLGEDLDNTPEPVRAALNRLGQHFNVDSLRNY